jgi:hypothetical protein
MPSVVVRMVVEVDVSVNVPRVVENSTAVPFGTGCPFCVTFAVTTTVESTSGLSFDVVTLRVTPVGGVVPPGGVTPPAGGAVGDSPLHAPNTSSSAMSAADGIRLVILIM